MMGTNIEFKSHQQKGTEINFGKRFYRLNKYVEKLASQRLCCFPVVALKPILAQNKTYVKVIIL